MEFRNLSSGDVPGILQIQQEAYKPEFIESSSVFEQRIQLFPAGCLGCFEASKFIAYAIAHPWRLGEIVPFDSLIEKIPLDADCLYIHDVAVSHDHGQEGIARRFITMLVEIAQSRGLKALTGVAVQKSEGIWHRLGFIEKHKLEYAPGGPGKYVIRKLDADESRTKKKRLI
nr:GNAT family N-acetyltransferase [Candidatus Sigynarchaeota archaeon]